MWMKWPRKWRPAAEMSDTAVEDKAAAGQPIDASPLFRGLQVKELKLQNRVVMAPMTRSFAPGGVLDPGMTDYYVRRAAGGTGLIVSEGTAVDHPVAHHTDRIPNFYGQAALARWKQVIDAVHKAGGKMFPQLWHTGLGRMAELTANPDELSIAPSIVGKRPLRAMAQSDIDAVIEAFASAAVSAKTLGFDGVAIHGAHGYLIDQFFWPRTNRRDDGYGGDLAGRLRFGIELVQEMRRRIGPDFPIMFRFSQWKATHYDVKLAETPDQLAEFLQPLAAAGVDIFDASTRRFWLPEFAGSDLNLAGWAKKLTGKISMAVGSVGLQGPLDVAAGLNEQDTTGVTTENLARLSEMMARDEFDLIGIGRIILSNPDWANLVRAGRFDQLRPYNPARTGEFVEPSEQG
jgi:2,4-dienoyl-CoA reductase-like NADH-dependent reductase (Old Yellow Enzyme family)